MYLEEEMQTVRRFDLSRKLTSAGFSPPEDNFIGTGGLNHQNGWVLLFGDLQRRHFLVTEPPHRLLLYAQLLLTCRGASPATVLAPSVFRAASPVQDGPLGVVRHRVVDGANVREEVKVLQDMSRQFSLVIKPDKMISLSAPDR